MFQMNVRVHKSAHNIFQIRTRNLGWFVEMGGDMTKTVKYGAKKSLDPFQIRDCLKLTSYSRRFLISTTNLERTSTIFEKIERVMDPKLFTLASVGSRTNLMRR